jgi:hypothetical protein
VGFSPLDKQLGLVKHGWSPETIQQAVALAIQIPSYERAATSFEQLTRVPISKSSLQQLTCEYGERLVDRQEQEAKEVMTLPAAEAEGEAWRAIPEPDSEEMAVAMDGGMINIRGEGWKEVKIVAVSAIETEEEAGQEPKVSLKQTSYRAGLWEAARFANHQWAEGCRRGLEKAQRVVCVNDGAAWIWAIVTMCYVPRCIEILDWWHAVEKLWEIAFSLWSPEDQQSYQWTEEQKSLLWAGDLRQIFRELRALWPRGKPFPDKIRLGIGYLFHHRWRMRYPEFRQAGCPIGSGSVESACKVVVQERMKQAGMRWSRAGAQAMLALRSVLLSERWRDVWPSLKPSTKPA